MQLARDAGWRNLLFWPTWSLAALAREEGRLDDADALLAEAVMLSPKIARNPRLAQVREEQALVAELRGDHDTAIRLNTEAAELRAASPR